MTVKNLNKKEDISISLEREPSDVLKPCPFCGSEDMTIENTWTACYWIECVCGVEVTGNSYPNDRSLKDHQKSKKSAIDKWNKRV